MRHVEIERFAAQVVESQLQETQSALKPAVTALQVMQLASRAARRASEMAADSPDAPRRACQAGCAACCRLAVSVTPVEALWIAARLRESQSAGELERLTARIAETSAAVSALSMEGRARVKIPCALLGQDGACSIYEFRPLGCRGWTSFSRQACEAALAEERPGQDGPMDRFALAAACGVTEGLERGLRSAGLDGGQYEFHSAVRASLAPGAAEAYAQGQAVFAGCARVRSERLRQPCDG